MEETLMNADRGETTKIKTHHARIVVDGTAENPYYSIEWFDPTKQENYLGYSSYYIGNVFNWLSECFEIVEAPKTNADRIRAMSDEELKDTFGGWSLCSHIQDNHNDFCNARAVCDGCILEWLQQPAEGD